MIAPFALLTFVFRELLSGFSLGVLQFLSQLRDFCGSLNACDCSERLFTLLLPLRRFERGSQPACASTWRGTAAVSASAIAAYTNDRLRKISIAASQSEGVG